MLIGHLPAGYLIGRALVRAPSRTSAPPLAAIMAGSVFPDIDLIYSYLFDHQRTHHHLYWTHIPAFWLAACAGVLLAWAAKRELRPPVALWFFLAGVLSHLLLDSIIGDIYWLIPFSYQPFSMFTVHPRYSPWYLNFVMHWVFGLELVLVVSAAVLAYGDLRRYRNRLSSRCL
jgi:inner membrane protein